MVCKKCGANNQEEFKFCQECGGPIEPETKVLANSEVNVSGRKIKTTHLAGIVALVLVLLVGGFFLYKNFSGQADDVGLYPIRIDKSWGYMNKDGELKVKPQYDFAGQFSEGFAAVIKVDQNGKRLCGLIDKTGKVIVELKYSYIRSFKEGLVAVAVGEGQSRKWGYMDRTGQLVIAAQYLEANNFSDGLAIVSAGKNKWGFIDKTGKFVVAPELSDRAVGFFEGHSDPIARFQNGLAPIADKDGLWGFIDKTGKFAIPPQYYQARVFAEELAAVAVGTNENNRKWGYVDKTGKMIIPPKFLEIGEFSEEKAIVAIAGPNGPGFADRLFGVINKKGEFVIQPIWPYFQITQNLRSWDARRGKFADGLLSVSKQTSARVAPNVGVWGFIDSKGKPVIEQKFVNVGDYNNGLALVVLEDGSMAYLDKTGNIIKPKQSNSSASSTNPNVQQGSIVAVEGYAQPGERRKLPDNERPRTPAPSTLRKDTLEAPDFYILDIMNWNLGQKHQVTVKKAVEWFGTPAEKKVDNNPTARMTTLLWKDFILVLDGVSNDDENGSVVWLQWQGPAALKSYRGIGIGDLKSKVIEKYGGNYRSRESGGLEWVIFTGNEAQGVAGRKIGFGVDPATQKVKSVFHGMLPANIGMVFPK